MDEGPDPDENEDPRDVTGPIYAVRMKKMGARDLVGLVSGDALSAARRGCTGAKTRKEETFGYVMQSPG
jgi:hypothetical protein